MKNFCTTLFLLFALTSYSQIINFTDNDLKNMLLMSSPTSNFAQDINGNNMAIDNNSNSEIEQSEALVVYRIALGSGFVDDIGGLEYFTNLTHLDVSLNQLSNLNATIFPNLISLKCSNNDLTGLIVTGLNLEVLWCDSNELTNLDASGLSNLQDLICNNNSMTSLTLTGTNNLQNLQCYNNFITSLDVSGFGDLVTLESQNNQIANIDLQGVNSLVSLDISNNQLTTLNLSDAFLFSDLNCHTNNLESIFLKNGSIEGQMNFSNNYPELQYICADEGQLSQVQNLITTYGYTDVNLNSYCSFTPGGEFYTITGINSIDTELDGCDMDDPMMPFLRFNISGGGLTGTTIADSTGVHNIPLQVGSYTLTPILDNPSFYNITPTDITVNFPSDASPYVQNFCLIPTGIHSDLDITLSPLVPARPGFDAVYQIIYANKGNQVQSGDVTLIFMDTLMEYFSAIPDADTQTTNSITWNYSNLQPFEARTFEVSFNINAPTETPPVDIGDILTFTTTINPTTADESPTDNTFDLEQTVVGSYDPNDVTCLQGHSVEPVTVGEYVHYLIRFENTGTFLAQNIVVRDDINIQKFDMNSFRIINGSHPFVTKITGNRVDFIFENVNLPFDDANNDGFVLFKIRTLPTLMEGDTFSNSAEIYFDFNFPIITNTFVTTVESQLGIAEFSNSEKIILYPNPTNRTLNIKTDLPIDTYEVYNLLGQKVNGTTTLSNDKSIDISNLESGNYFLKLISNQGTEYLKFIKY